MYLLHWAIFTQSVTLEWTVLEIEITYVKKIPSCLRVDTEHKCAARAWIGTISVLSMVSHQWGTHHEIISMLSMGFSSVRYSSWNHFYAQYGFLISEVLIMQLFLCSVWFLISEVLMMERWAATRSSGSWENGHWAAHLTHWGWNKMAAISQTTFSDAFSWMKMIEFSLKFHWSLFLGVQLTIFHHWFR